MLPADSNMPRVLGDSELGTSIFVILLSIHILTDYAVVAEQAFGGIVVPGSGRLVACLGIDDLVIVDLPDALMVTTRARSQEVKTLVKRCKAAGWTSLV